MQHLSQTQKNTVDEIKDRYVKRYNIVKQNPELYNGEVYIVSFNPPSVIIETIWTNEEFYKNYILELVKLYDARTVKYICLYQENSRYHGEGYVYMYIGFSKSEWDDCLRMCNYCHFKSILLPYTE